MSRSKIIIYLFLALVVSMAVILIAPSFQNLYITSAEFTSSRELGTHYSANRLFAKTEAEYVFYSDYVYQINNVNRYEYYVIWTEDDRFVLVKTGMDVYSDLEYENLTLSGMIKKPDDVENDIIRELSRDLAEYLDTTVSEMYQRISTYILDTTTSKLFIQIAVGVVYALVLLLFIGIVKAIFDVANYRRNKYYKRLAPDSLETADRINDSVSREMEREQYIIKHKFIKVTENWIIHTTGLSFAIKNRSDLIWAYTSITKNRVNGIPAGKTHAIVLSFKDRKRITVATKKAAVSTELIETLRRRCGQAVFGYSDDLNRIFLSDFDQFMRIASAQPDPQSRGVSDNPMP